MFNFFLSPIGKYVAITMLVLGLTGYVIYQIRQDAIDDIQLETTKDELRRIGNAVTSGDAVNTSPDRVRDTDGHKRD